MRPLPDDHPDKWEFEAHTQAKHEVLWKYLEPWTYKLSSMARSTAGQATIRVIDAFAGRGDYTRVKSGNPYELNNVDTPTEIPGSPQIILDRLTEFDDKFDVAEVIFIEDNDSNFSHLSSVIDETSGYSEKIQLDPIPGRFEDELLNVINPDRLKCPTFLFIDPFGFNSLDYDVISSAGSTDKVDLLITFMYRHMYRFLDSEAHEDAFDTIFGTSSWRDDIESVEPENWEALVEYYEHRLKLNGPSNSFSYKINKSDKNQTLYYLVFGSNSAEGVRTFREVVNNCGTGNFAYAPANPQYDRQQMTLGNTMQETKDFLVNQFQDHRITFREVMQICSAEFPYREQTESDYKAAIKDLEHEGGVEIVRIKSVHSGVTDDDLIDFRTDNA